MSLKECRLCLKLVGFSILEPPDSIAFYRTNVHPFLCVYQVITTTWARDQVRLDLHFLAHVRSRSQGRVRGKNGCNVSSPYVTGQTSAEGRSMKANSKCSPLLKLPAEIPGMIFSHAVGNYLIHIYCRPYPKCPRLPLAHAICTAKVPEAAASQQPIFGYSAIGNEQDSDDHGANSLGRHTKCGTGALDFGSTKNHFSLLRVSRQTYQEANALVWTANTFPFNEAQAFAKFMSLLDIAQMRKLTKLHISRDQTYDLP